MSGAGSHAQVYGNFARQGGELALRCNTYVARSRRACGLLLCKRPSAPLTTSRWKNSMRNEYWLLRHGRSLANEAQIIVSKEDNGILEKWTLSQAGIEQAETSGRLFGEALRGQPGRTVAVYASPFSRTLKTAEVAVRAAGLDAVDVQVAEDLRERYFGSALELQPYDKAYGTIWEHDAADAHYRPGGGDGESVEAVAARLRGFFMLLESHHDGAVVLLVSHGDTLSIMQAAMTGGDVRHHRQFAFDTAELRKLPVSASTASTV